MTGCRVPDIKKCYAPIFHLVGSYYQQPNGMAQTPICTPLKASPGNGGQLVFLKGFCIPCFMLFHVPGSYRHVCFQKGKY